MDSLSYVLTRTEIAIESDAWLGRLIRPVNFLWCHWPIVMSLSSCFCLMTAQSVSDNQQQTASHGLVNKTSQSKIHTEGVSFMPSYMKYAITPKVNFLFNSFWPLVSIYGISLISQKNLKWYITYTIVSWSNHKQWQMAHTSDLIMIIR